jgi:adenylate cyclase
VGVEIERKFLVCNDTWRDGQSGTTYRQGYLCTSATLTARVRIAGTQGWLTLKGPVSGLSRLEYEYPIPMDEAAEMLARLCQTPLIEKIRYRVPYSGLIWEIDQFSGENAGLVVAEVELTREDQLVVLPPWVGRELTGDPRYYNACLAIQPYSRW